MVSSPFQLEYKGNRGLLMKALEWILGLRYLDALYRRHVGNEQGRSFSTLALNLLNIRYRVEGEGLGAVPRSGPLVVIANHPIGGAEGVALIDAILEVRPDTKVLTNQLLGKIPGLQSLFICVDILGETTRESRKAANRKAVDVATQWVSDGGVLIIFPAGEVAGWDWQSKQLKEAPWRHTAGRILQTTQASLLPVYITGRNSWFFYLLGLIHPLLRTAWLARELINKRGQTITMKCGFVEPFRNLSHCTTDDTLTNAMRLRTLLLSESDLQTSSLTINDGSYAQPVPPVAPEKLCENIEKLPRKNLLLTKGDFEVWYSAANEIPYVLLEIGRLREISFRAAGEGTGHEIDIDRFDRHYLHLFLWNRAKSEIAGAYRLGVVDSLIAKGGVEALYSRTLFRYDRRFLDQLGGCVEMGRSFVRAEYQRSLSALQLLWKGIGAWVVRHPQYRVLYGPVSISSEYKELSRHLMAMSLEENYFDQDLADLVEPNDPLTPEKHLPWSREMLAGLGNVEQISSLVRVLEKDRGLPVLLRQYLKLNGVFVGFNVDPVFNNALDGLIIVDLLKSDRKVLERYLGSDGYQKLKGYHISAAVPA